MFFHIVMICTRKEKGQLLKNSVFRFSNVIITFNQKMNK